MSRGDVGGMDTDEHGTPLEDVVGWSGSGDMVTGDTGKTVGAQADFKSPGDYTIQFSIVPVGPDSPPQPPAPDPPAFWAALQAIAIIRWSVAGVTILRQISVGSGVSISGVGQGVSVIVEDVTEGTPPSIVLGRPYKVGITIGKGTRPADTNPPIYYPENVVQVIAGMGGLVVPVPQNCGIKSVLVTVIDQAGAPIPEQGARVTQTDSNNTALCAYDPRSQFFAPILPGTVNIVLDNLTASTQQYAVIFGIDG